METKHEHQFNQLSDQQLEEIAGGHDSNASIPIVVTNNHSPYSSGDTPKYAAGQNLYIECLYGSLSFKLPCSVLGVSTTPTGGSFREEFVYSVEILQLEVFKILPTHPLNTLMGKVYHGVYESCLYTEQ